MLNPVAVLVLGSVLLFSGQSAQACHGRKCCSKCAKGYSGTYGYVGYGYGSAYGYGANYTYGYPNTYAYPYTYGNPYYYGYGYGSRDLDRSDTGTGRRRSSADADADDRLARLEDVERRLDEIDSTLRELLRRMPPPK
jgi:hypothetical protein